MKEELLKVINAIVDGDDATAKEHLSTFVTAKTKEIVAEGQGNLFGDDTEQPKNKRFLVTPVGVSFDTAEEAAVVSKRHKGSKVVDRGDDTK